MFPEFHTEILPYIPEVSALLGVHPFGLFGLIFLINEYSISCNSGRGDEGRSGGKESSHLTSNKGDEAGGPGSPFACTDISTLFAKPDISGALSFKTA